jgi:hypothetical protein
LSSMRSASVLILSNVDNWCYLFFNAGLIWDLNLEMMWNPTIWLNIWVDIPF